MSVKFEQTSRDQSFEKMFGILRQFDGKIEKLWRKFGGSFEKLSGEFQRGNFGEIFGKKLDFFQKFLTPIKTCCTFNTFIGCTERT